MDYIVKPFEGINDIKFGMTQLEVELKVGKAESSKTILLNNIVEYRDDILFVYVENSLADIRFSDKFQYEKHNIVLDETKLINNEKTVDLLINKAGTLPSDIVKNCIVFHGIGVCFLGFKNAKMQTEKELRFYSKERARFYKIFLKA